MRGLRRAGEDNGLLEEPPLLQIRRSLRRPSADVLARFKDASTGFLADCMDGRGALDWRIKPVDPGRAAFAGAALPCLCGPGDNLALLAALSVAQPGDAIMAAGESFEGLAICGDRVAGMARNRGAVAIVLDGMARDTPGIREAGLPLFCRGITPNSCNASGPGTVGEPIVVGGVPVRPGDVVVGDCDGVVVVPEEKIDSVLARLDRVRAAEAEMDARVAGGLGIPAVIERLAAEGRVEYLD